MSSTLRSSLFVLSIALTACSGAQTGSGDATPAATSIATSTAIAPPAGSSAPDATSAEAASATSTSAPVDSAIPRADAPLAHTVSSSAGPAPSTSGSAVPMAPPTADELERIAICNGKKSMFTDKELKLLDLAEKSNKPDLQETAAALRQRRKDMVTEMCERLRADGKL